MLLIYNKCKFWGLIFLLTLGILISSCVSNSSSSTKILVSQPTKSNLGIGESETVLISLSNIALGEITVVQVSSNNSAIISVSPSSCTLSMTTKSCLATITGHDVGSTTFNVSAIGAATVTSSAITVISTPITGIITGNIDGLMFRNGTLISGNAALPTVDDSAVQSIVMDANNNIYAGTLGAVFGGFGAGKVFKYNSSLGYWVMLSGVGAGGSLDGSGVNALAVDSNNNVYAATQSGNVFKYANGIWTILGYSLNDPIKALAIDSNNNIYAGTENSGDVFKYTNGTWLSLGAPDSSIIVQAIAISEDGHIYTATGNDSSGNNTNGQVYVYEGNSTWRAISSFSNEGAVYAVAVFESNVFAGTASGNVHKYDGSSWNQLGNSLDTTPVFALAANASTVFAGTQGSSSNGQVYRYNGSSWSQVNSLNNGSISTILVHDGHLYTCTANAGSVTQGAVYIHNDHAWNLLGNGSLDGTPIYSITIDHMNNFYAGTQNNVYKHIVGNDGWILLGNIYVLDGSGINALATYESNIYAGTIGGNVFRSNSSNGNWVMLGDSEPDFSVSSLVINTSSGKLYISKNYTDNNHNVVYGVVLKYDNTSNRWIKLRGDGASGSIDGSTIQSLTIDALGNIYAATAGNGAGGMVWEYPIGGSSWSVVGLGTLDSSHVMSLTTDSDLNVYAGTQNGNIFKYNGSYWIPITNNPLDGSSVSNLTFDSAGNLYATTFGGIIWEYMQSNNLWVNTNYGIGASINIAAGKAI